MSVDHAKERFDRLRAEWEGQIERIDTEADVRFQIINRILTEVLGWSHYDVRNEPHVESGFIDYLASDGSGSKLVIEAKRVSSKLVDVAQPGLRWYKVGGPVLKSARDGIEQAKRYCTDVAAMFALVTNGLQWVGFWALRTDGLPPSEGRAAVFPSLQSVSDDFALFYELFSPIGLQGRLYQVHINDAEGLQVQFGDRLEAAIPEARISLATKSQLAIDLEPVFRRFFSNISGEDDPEMLAECFVESRESREADDNLRKLTRDLVNKVDVVDSGKAGQLEDHLRFAVESGTGEFVLIVGNKGAGKTTFIDRFFRLVIDSRLRRRCLLLRVDLADSSGDRETVAAWLTSRLVAEVELGLFDDGNPSYDQLQGAFFQEYERWRNGEHRFLYERDKNEFKEKFGEWVYTLRNEEPARYLEALLKSAAGQRKLMPCLVFDNTDHYPQSFQEAVFQYAQSVFRSVFSCVICPITDRTIWQLSKHGPFQSYETRTFYLPVPSAKAVLEKRVGFLRSKAEAEGKSGRYFLERGIRVTIKNIDAFAACVEEVFVREDYIGRVVGWLSNHDIRRSLRIAEGIITSPTLKVTDLVNAKLSGGDITPRRREIKLALIRGKYVHFIAGGSDFVINLFSVDQNAATTPLLRLSVLRVLADIDTANRDPRKAYMMVRDLVSYFEPVGIRGGIVRDHLQVLLDHRLVQPYDPTDHSITDALELRITPAGRIHYEFAFARQEGSYMSEMALTTPVRSQTYIDGVRDIIESKHSARFSDWIDIRASFAAYCLHEDSLHVSVPNSSSYDGQRVLRREFEDVWEVEGHFLGQQALELDEGGI